LIPVLETTAARPRRSETEVIGSRGTYQLLGLDLIAVQNLAERRRPDQSWFGQTGSPEASVTPRETLPAASAFWDTFRNPRSVFISEFLARREGLAPGSELQLILNEQIVPLRVAGVIPTDPAQPQAPAELMVMDLPALQRLTGLTGQVSRVEFILEDGPQRAERWQELRTLLERQATNFPGVVPTTPRWQVASPADRRESGEVMTRAFRLNLTILSLLALVVGLYLIFQALDGAVVRRREEIAILRSLGVPPRLIQRAWLCEAAVLGLAGGVMGLLLGWLGAQGAVRPGSSRNPQTHPQR
jgi:putative ABC transport system permease protein